MKRLQEMTNEQAETTALLKELELVRRSFGVIETAFEESLQENLAQRIIRIYNAQMTQAESLNSLFE
jgi:hypothetical protein